MSATGATPPGGRGDGSDTSKLLSLTNDLRETVGLAPLTLDAPATGVAGGWAQRLAQAGTLSHNPDLAAEMPLGWAKVGENVGMGGDAESIHRALVRSNSHYQNLVQPGYTRVGIAVVPKDGLIYVVQDFLRYASEPVPTTLAEPSASSATTTSTSTTTTTTTPGAVPPVPVGPEPGFGVVAPGPAPQIDLADVSNDAMVPDAGGGQFGFILEQLRAWDRGR